MNQPHQTLAQLKDIHLPAPSPWWDLAVGWWLLLGLGIAFLFWGTPKLHTLIRTRRNKRLLKQDMQAQLQTICAAYQRDKDVPVMIADINVLLKKVVLTLFPERQVASLTGQAWLHFLDSLWQEKPQISFTSEVISRLLVDGAYRIDMEADANDVQQLCDVVKSWLNEVQRHV